MKTAFPVKFKHAGLQIKRAPTETSHPLFRCGFQAYGFPESFPAMNGTAV